MILLTPNPAEEPIAARTGISAEILSLAGTIFMFSTSWERLKRTAQAIIRSIPIYCERSIVSFNKAYAKIAQKTALSTNKVEITPWFTPAYREVWKVKATKKVPTKLKTADKIIAIKPATQTFLRPYLFVLIQSLSTKDQILRPLR